MSMRTADIVVAAIIMCLGIVVALDSWLRGSGWGPEGPRAGFFPFLLAIVVVVGCMVVVGQALRGTGTARAGVPFVLAGGLRPVLTVFIPAALMVLLTEAVGLYLAAMIYLTVYIRGAGEFRWRTALSVGILVPVVFYILFDKLFLIPMPRGVFGGRLGF